MMPISQSQFEPRCETCGACDGRWVVIVGRRCRDDDHRRRSRSAAGRPPRRGGRRANPSSNLPPSSATANDVYVLRAEKDQHLQFVALSILLSAEMQATNWNSQPLSTWKYRDVRDRIFSAEYDDDDELSTGSFQQLMTSIINAEKFDGRDVIALATQIRPLDDSAIRAAMVARKWLPADFDRHSQIQVRYLKFSNAFSRKFSLE
jgi:hypothetical protein